MLPVLLLSEIGLLYLLFQLLFAVNRDFLELIELIGQIHEHELATA